MIADEHHSRKEKDGIEGSNQCTKVMGIHEENYTQRSDDCDHGIYVSEAGKSRDGIQSEQEIDQREEKADAN